MRFGKRVEASSWVIDGQKRACIRGKAARSFPGKTRPNEKRQPALLFGSERAILSNRGRALECFRRCRLCASCHTTVSVAGAGKARERVRRREKQMAGGEGTVYVLTQTVRDPMRKTRMFSPDRRMTLATETFRVDGWIASLTHTPNSPRRTSCC